MTRPLPQGGTDRETHPLPQGGTDRETHPLPQGGTDTETHPLPQVVLTKPGSDKPYNFAKSKDTGDDWSRFS